MKASIERIVIGILAITLIGQQVNSCKADGERKQLLEQLSQFKFKQQDFEVRRKADSSTIATQQQAILSQKEAIRLGLLEMQDNIKKVLSQVGFQYDFFRDSVKVPFVPPNFADTTGFVRIENGKRVQDSVAVPQPFYVNDKWLIIAGQVRKSGLFLDSISIPNKAVVTVGFERRNIFSRLKPVVTLKNDNPYIRVNTMNNVVIKEKKGLLESKLFWMAVGSAATIGLQKAIK